MPEKVTAVSEFRLDRLRPGVRICIKHKGRYTSPLFGVVLDPETAEVVMRLSDQANAEQSDIKCRMGSRAFTDGAELRTVDTKDVNESDITWGVLGPNRELVVENLDGSGQTLFFGCEIEDVTVSTP